MGLLSKLFGKSKKSGKKASVSSDRAWQGGRTRGPRVAGSGSGEQLVSAETVLAIPEIQAAMKYPQIVQLCSATYQYDRALRQEKVPSGSDQDFMKHVGMANKNVMTAFSDYMETLISTTEEMNRVVASGAQVGESEVALMPPDLAAGVANACLRIANTMKSQELQMNKIYDDAVGGYRNGNVSLMEGKSYFDLFDQTTMYQSTGEEKILGAGALNTVRSVQYDGGDKVIKDGQVHIKGDSEDNTETSVFRDLGETEENLYDYGGSEVGIRNVNTAQRDVAVSRIDRLFGFDVITSTQLAKNSDGGAASLMNKVTGGEAMEYVAYTSSDLEGVSKEDYVQQGLEDLIAFFTTYSSRFEKKKDRAIENLRSGRDVGIDLSDPKVTIQLMRMAVIDRIVGHGDRHLGNFMFEEGTDGVKKLKGIDNDTSFSKIKGHERTLTLIKTAFPFIPRELKDKILEVSEADIRNAITGLIAKPNIEAACQRFTELQEHVKQLEASGQVKDELTRADADSYADGSLAPYQNLMRNATMMRVNTLGRKGYAGKVKDPFELNWGEGFTEFTMTK